MQFGYRERVVGAFYSLRNTEDDLFYLSARVDDFGVQKILVILALHGDFDDTETASSISAHRQPIDTEASNLWVDVKSDEPFVLLDRKFSLRTKVVCRDLFGFGRRERGRSQANYQDSTVGVSKCGDIFSKFVLTEGICEVVGISSLRFK